LQKSIAFFDFDGTITTKDTMLALAVFHTGKLKFLLKMLRISPSLIALKLGFISAQKAKEIFLKCFFEGMSLETFTSLCHNFNNTVLPTLIKSDAMNAINNYKKEGTTVVIVSASAENWLKPWCDKNELQLLSTRLEDKDGRITGKISGINCNGKEKVSRINESFRLTDFKNIYAYGDSSGDKEMLAIATHSHFREFKA